MNTKLRIGHSPDPDDAFMVWAFHAGAINTHDFTVELVPKDIETLNRRAVENNDPLEVTALSAASYARVADNYWLLKHGASFGDGYGPIVVSAKKEIDLKRVTILTPGEYTTATAALRLAIPGVKTQHMAFDQILPAIQRGEADAGLLIHEGQLTWQRENVHNHLDLGIWWKDEENLPLPLGVNTLHKNLGEKHGAQANQLLHKAIETGLERREEALQYARGFGRGIPTDDANTFVGMYVNEMTRNMGPRGTRAIERFLERARTAGHLPHGANIEWAPE